MKKPKSTIESPEQAAVPDESFLRRWSKRKLKDANDTEADAEGGEQAQTGRDWQLSALNNTHSSNTTYSSNTAANNIDASITDLPDLEGRDELTDADMPPLETLDENSDFSGFFSHKVSEALRRQALQKLFHLPQFNIVDGLNDYDEDYTQFESLGGIVTQEMKRMLQREAEQLKEKFQENNTVHSDNGEDIEHHQQEAVETSVCLDESADNDATDERMTVQPAKDT